MAGESAPDSRRLYARLLQNVRPYWRIFAGSIAAMAILAATDPALAAILKPTLDGTVIDKDPEAVMHMAVLIVALFFVRGVAGFASQTGLGWVGSRLVADLRNGVFQRLVGLPASFYDQRTRGSLISKVTYDAEQVREAGTFVLTVLVRDSLAILGLVGWMLYLDWQLTLVALVSGPPVVLIVRYFGRRLRRMSHNLQHTMGDLTHVLDETIGGLRIVRTYGGEQRERHRFDEAVNRARHFQMKFIVAANASAPIVQFIAAIALAVLLYVAGQRLTADEITVGTFVSFFTAMAMLFSPLKRLTNVNGRLQKGLAASESVFRLMDETPEEDAGTVDPGRVRGRIEFEDVSFRYETERGGGVRDLRLRIEPGETIALVGPSGAGKSTLVHLLMRLYVPGEGRVLLDGMDIASMRLRSLRDNIAFVGQDVVLFDDTLRANIAYGALAERADEAIRRAAEAAHVMEFAHHLPRGLDTPVGDRGVLLSGGQRQRLAIARAFLKDAPVIVLDEATSSLDTESERHIQDALGALRRDRTTIVIAHRLSSIEWADRIVVMNAGRIEEVGTHASLLERNSLYAGLYRFQFSRRPRDAHAAGAS